MEFWPSVGKFTDVAVVEVAALINIKCYIGLGYYTYQLER